jgi:hypothetical protein
MVAMTRRGHRVDRDAAATQCRAGGGGGGGSPATRPSRAKCPGDDGSQCAPGAIGPRGCPSFDSESDRDSLVGRALAQASCRGRTGRRCGWRRAPP